MGEAVILLASAARTADETTDEQPNLEHRGLHLVINVTAVNLTPSVVPKIQGFDAGAQGWYDILAGAAITGTGRTVLKVYPGVTVAANVAVSEALPSTWRVFMDHAGTDSITYSVAAHLMR